MRYFIAYILNGEAAAYDKEVGDGLARAFGLKELSKKTPRHITLKYPFITDDKIEEVERILEKFVIGRKPTPLQLGGIGSFDGRVVFMDVKGTIETKQMIDALATELGRLPWMTFDQYDGGVHLHSTLAYAENEEMFRGMMEYVAKVDKHFDIFVDNICILKREPEKWVIHKKYKLVG